MDGSVKQIQARDGSLFVEGKCEKSRGGQNILPRGDSIRRCISATFIVDCVLDTRD
jgi:hypothetical protein